MSAGKAMGPRDFDYLELRNAFASVVITREPTSAGPAYCLSHDGDGAYSTLALAVAAAWRALADYERGRAD